MRKLESSPHLWVLALGLKHSLWDKKYNPKFLFCLIHLAFSHPEMSWSCFVLGFWVKFQSVRNTTSWKYQLNLYWSEISTLSFENPKWCLLYHWLRLIYEKIHSRELGQKSPLSFLSLRLWPKYCFIFFVPRRNSQTSCLWSQKICLKIQGAISSKSSRMKE